MGHSLVEELRAQIAWLQDYERYGGLMTPPRAYAILTVLDAALNRILEQQGEIDILERERGHGHEENRL